MIIESIMKCISITWHYALGNQTRHEFLNEFIMKNHFDTIDLFYIVQESFTTSQFV